MKLIFLETKHPLKKLYFIFFHLESTSIPLPWKLEQLVQHNELTMQSVWTEFTAGCENAVYNYICYYADTSLHVRVASWLHEGMGK